mgnify:CR=1 FL=1
MSSDDLVIANQTFPATRADINSNLQALGSLMSGASAPSTTYAYMWWADTTNGVLKQRNSSDNAWVVRATLSDDRVVTKTTTYSVVLGDFDKLILCSASGGAFTVNLPAAATAGDGFRVSFKKTDATFNAVTLDGNSSETIDGNTTITLDSPYDMVELTCDGSNWSIRTRNLGVPDTGQISGHRNLFYNGAFQVHQRGTTYALSTSAAYTGADRWWAYMSSSAAGIANRNTSVPTGLGFQYSMKVGRNNGSSATGQITFGQVLETQDSIILAGKTVTFSFYAKKGANYSSSSDVLNAYLYTGTGTDESTGMAGWTGTATPITLAATLTTSWQRFQATVTLSSSITQIGCQFFYNGSGTAGADDNFYITGIDLEPGPRATPFAFRSFADELRLCQRYYEKSFAYGTAPAQNVGSNSGEAQGIAGKAGANNEFINAQFQVRKRAAATVTLFNPTNTNGQVNDITAAADCSSTGVGMATDMGLTVSCNGNASTAVGNLIAIHWTAAAEL